MRIKLWQGWAIWIGITCLLILGAMVQEEAYQNWRANINPNGYYRLEDYAQFESLDPFIMAWIFIGSPSLIVLLIETIKCKFRKRRMSIWKITITLFK